MFDIFFQSIQWIPFVLRFPITVVAAVLLLLVLVKIISVILSIIGHIIDIFT